MRIWLIGAAGLCLAGVASGAMATPDHEAGTPLSPAEAAGAWTLESGGHSLCMIKLEARPAGAGYAAQAQPSCRQTLGGEAAGWKPTHDGMSLVTADGASLLRFARWSNSLFVSHQASGVDVQLRRGQ